MEMIKYHIRERIAYITLSRPEKRNALNAELVSQLKNAFKKAENDTSVKVVVLNADGDVFCAGADLEYLQQLQKNSYEENRQDSANLAELFNIIYTLKKVVIAEINGHAIAGGCGMAAVCDISFAVPEANFGYTEVKIGFIPAIVMVFLLRKTGEGKTKELMLSGNLINAQTAKEYGLINFIAAKEKLAEEVYEYASKLCHENSSQSMELTKTMMVALQEKNLNDALSFAATMNAEARGTEDCKKGISAFLNKQKIKW
ncbi:MAG TPA: enoyl-CoA hydratase/isomerase family protein [Cytophagaceae bacterium]|jgi:methylglutaconyl-CoA hydratase|nr:enoyl-CoA hydratase/isomerase family protein [Cytophagaceae bacterium]